jgi:hypothetical protein
MAKRAKTVQPILIEDDGVTQYLLIPKGCAFPKVGYSRFRDGQSIASGNKACTWNYYGWTSKLHEDQVEYATLNRSGIASEDFFVVTREAVIPRTNELGDICP